MSLRICISSLTRATGATRARPARSPVLRLRALKASSYFLIGGDSDDLIQEGLVGLYKAIRDYRTDASRFRNFAELCITRQIITAVKTSTRNKHAPLNQYVSFASRRPAPATAMHPRRGPPGLADHDPSSRYLDRGAALLVDCLATTLSALESARLSLYLDGPRTRACVELVCDTKTVDNALQRVKRKVGVHQATRAVPAEECAQHRSGGPRSERDRVPG